MTLSVSGIGYGYPICGYKTSLTTQGIDAGEEALHQADANKIVADAQYDAGKTCAKKHANRLAHAFNI